MNPFRFKPDDFYFPNSNAEVIGVEDAAKRANEVLDGWKEHFEHERKWALEQEVQQVRIDSMQLELNALYNKLWKIRELTD